MTKAQIMAELVKHKEVLNNLKAACIKANRIALETWEDKRFQRETVWGIIKKAMEE